jgi:hypothetical protein
MYKIFTSLLLLVLAVSSVFGQIRMKKSKDGILFTEDNKNVLFYQLEPKSEDGKFERCNYIHPLWAADGTVLTEDFPKDHLHHRGIFWAWHQVWIGEQRIGDPWEIKSFDQKVTEVEFMAQKNGSGILNTEVEWESDKWIKEGKKVPYLKENTTISIHPMIDNYRQIDFEIKLLALEENLTIGGSEDVKGYSGFSVRMKLPEDISFSGPEGKLQAIKTAVESNGYVDMEGSILKNGKRGGIVMVDHPENPDYPQGWILRERKSMQNAAWPGNQLIAISTKDALVLKYSLIVYSGELKDKKIRKIIR